MKFQKSDIDEFTTKTGNNKKMSCYCLIISSIRTKSINLIIAIIDYECHAKNETKTINLQILNNRFMIERHFRRIFTLS